MVTVYVSSTYHDLTEHREAVCSTLRRNGHQVVNMEDYTATPEQPLDTCLGDVARCQVYVGIFAWRYGFVPQRDNPERKSITELEFRHAVKHRLPCFIFVADPDGDWKPSLMDDGPAGDRIRALRSELLNDFTVRLFREAQHLANEVNTSLAHWERTHQKCDARADSTRVVSRGLDALVDLMSRPEVQRAVSDFQADFRSACHHIKLLADYKELHDLLQALRSDCFNPIDREVKRGDPSDIPWENFVEYDDNLRSILSKLRSVAVRGAVPLRELGWVDELAAVHQTLSEVITAEDPGRIAPAISPMKRVLDVQPARIDARLNAAAASVRLGDLTQNMMRVRAELDGLSLDEREQDHIREIEEAIDALVRLNAELGGRVDEHYVWQDFDDDLRQMEAFVDHDLPEAIQSWRRFKARAEPLFAESSQEWAVLIRADCERLEGAIAVQDPLKTRQLFSRFRNRAYRHFDQIDDDLKRLCEGLREVGRPLATVLRMAE